MTQEEVKSTDWTSVRKVVYKGIIYDVVGVDEEFEEICIKVPHKRMKYVSMANVSLPQPRCVGTCIIRFYQ